MDIDHDRIDDAMLALLYLGLHDSGRTWKGFDWEAMSLQAQGEQRLPSNFNIDRDIPTWVSREPVCRGS